MRITFQNYNEFHLLIKNFLIRQKNIQRLYIYFYIVFTNLFSTLKLNFYFVIVSNEPEVDRKIKSVQMISHFCFSFINLTIVLQINQFLNNVFNWLRGWRPIILTVLSICRLRPSFELIVKPRDSTRPLSSQINVVLQYLCR